MFGAETYGEATDGGSAVSEVMEYTTQSEIEAAIPTPDLINALDDDGDGAPDAGLLDIIIQRASQTVDAYLAPIYAVPFEETPQAARDAAFVFACELIYDRREKSDSNPFRKRADDWRDRLEKIGAGELPLDAATAKSFSPGVAITDANSLNATTR